MEGSQQDGGAREHGRMSGIVITLKRDGNSGKEEIGRFRAEDEGCQNGVRTPEKTNRDGRRKSFRNSMPRHRSEIEAPLETNSGRRAEDGRRRMNERIALEGEIRLKKERWLMEEQMRHIQEKRKMSMKEKQKCLPEERCKRINDKERIDFDEDEIEEKPKLPKRKRKNLSRMTVAELQQKVNIKASSNMVLIPQNWSFRGEYSQDKSEMGKLAWKLTGFIKRGGTVKIRQSSRENRMIRQQFRFKLRAHDNIYQDGKVRGKTRPLDFKIVDPAWMKKGVVRKLRKNEIEFQKCCFKRTCQTESDHSGR
ncbi:uncharacterized protein TNCV_3455221 [Trichonephila clavipes]|nr:uncharacterized protein TNCV_3455221 [Trichonephila clavipes]